MAAKSWVGSFATLFTLIDYRKETFATKQFIKESGFSSYRNEPYLVVPYITGQIDKMETAITINVAEKLDTEGARRA